MSRVRKARLKERTYEVGRGKPPKEYQFGEGVSGNPGGPKVGSRRSRSFDDILNEKVSVTVKGKMVRMTRREIGYRQLGRKVEEGDHRAIKTMIEHDHRKIEGEANPDPYTFDPEFRKSVLADYKKELKGSGSAKRIQPKKRKQGNGSGN